MPQKKLKGKAKPKKVTPQRSPMDMAASVAQRVNLDEVLLLASQCEQTEEARSGLQEVQVYFKASTKYDKDSGSVLVTPQFRLRAFREDSNKEEASVSIDATLLLAYHVDPTNGLMPEDFRYFGEINGIYNAWPYWREFVQSTIARMGLPRLVIPVFRLSAPKQQEVFEKPAVKRKRAAKKRR